MKNDEIGSVLARFLQTACAIGSSRNPEARLAKVQRKKICNVALILNDQDFPASASFHGIGSQLARALNCNTSTRIHAIASACDRKVCRIVTLSSYACNNRLRALPCSDRQFLTEQFYLSI